MLRKAKVLLLTIGLCCSTALVFAAPAPECKDGVCPLPPSKNAAETPAQSQQQPPEVQQGQQP